MADIKRYYAQLHLLQNRFKIESGDKGPFNFSWSDPYAGTIYTLPDFDYELASVLYNLGSLHTSLGAAEKRDTSESMKVACTHFQCAAWAFHTLPDKYPKVYTPDISPDLMAVLSQICLAQAQECILEKSILDHRKPQICAKVGAQVADFYRQAHHKIVSSNAKTDLSEDTICEIVGKEFSKGWTAYVHFKSVYYKAVSYFYMGSCAQDSSKMGEAIAYYEHASKCLVECGTAAKNLSDKYQESSDVSSCLIFTSDIIDGVYENIKKENEYIYHESPVEFESLPELKGAVLVKGIGFEVSDSEISGQDIFYRLVPLEAHAASSLYSEEKARLLREVGDVIEEKGVELAVFLSSMKLEDVPNPGDHISLPQEVIECAASLSAKDNALGKLTDAMDRIGNVQL